MKKLQASAAGATTLLLSIGIAAASGPPALKEGLWSLHRQTTTSPGGKKGDGTQTICRSHAFDEYEREYTKKSMQNCSKFTEKFDGGKYFAESRCALRGSVVDTKTTGFYTGNTAFHSESHATYTPPIDGLTGAAMIEDEKYIGSCPAGIQPGDIVAPDGRVIHSWKH